MASTILRFNHNTGTPGLTCELYDATTETDATNALTSYTPVEDGTTSDRGRSAWDVTVSEAVETAVLHMHLFGSGIWLDTFPFNNVEDVAGTYYAYSNVKPGNELPSGSDITFSVTDLLRRKDAREIGDLVSDTSTQVSVAGLATDAVLDVAMDDAKGAFLASVERGGRYALADIQGLTGLHLAHMQRILAELTIYYLIRRRPKLKLEQLQYYEQMHDAILKPLRDGDEIFPIDGTIEASRAFVDGPGINDYPDYGLIRDIPNQRFYPARRTVRNR